MCFDPVTLTAMAVTAAVTAATSAIGTGIQASQAKKQVAAQDEYQGKVFQQNLAASQQALASAQERQTLDTTRQQRNLVDQTQQARLDALSQRGQAEAYAAQNGMSGLSVNQLFQDFDRQLGGINVQFSEASNALGYNDQQQRKQLAQQANNQANSVAQGVVDFTPGVFSQALTAGATGAVTGAANSFLYQKQLEQQANTLGTSPTTRRRGPAKPLPPDFQINPPINP